MQLLALCALLVIDLSAGAAELVHVTGTVQIENRSGKSPAEVGSKVSEGDFVVTSAASLAVVKFDTGKVKLDANTRVSFDKLKGEKVLNLKKGGLFSKIRKRIDERKKDRKLSFRLKSKSATMGVRGTEFFAAYGRGSDFWMCVNEGSVLIRSRKDKKTTVVKEGEGVFVTQADGTTPPKFYEWTTKLNWNMDSAQGGLENELSIDSAYSDLLDVDYD